jgi:tripeptide aminopeptidase
MPIESVLDRFLRYVRIDTQSSEESETAPTTAKQWDLARLLASELERIGMKEISLSDKCVLMATLPANLADPNLPTVGFLAHLDTSPAVSGAGVKPQLVDYQGGDLTLPGDPSVVLRESECPELGRARGKRIVTTDGTTLLGADDKAGVAEIMSAMDRMLHDDSIKHGKIRIAFTPDEEVGAGTANFDVAAFGARVAYTVDGGEPGEIENETFSADGATVTIHGHNHHPGYAKGIMVNAVRVAADFIARLPSHRAPEHTAGREPYLHADSLTGNVETVTIRMIVRAFDLAGLRQMEAILEEIKRDLALVHPKARIEVQIREQYRNMREKLDQVPAVMDRAVEAMKRLGITPKTTAIRGGTDGARLTERGLPTPNLFAGGVNFHSKKEWVAVESLEQAAKTIIEIARLWAEKPSL